MLIVAANEFRRQTSAGHSHEAQRRKVPLPESRHFQEVVGIGDSGKIGAAALRKFIEEALVEDGTARHVDARAHGEVGVKDGKPVGIVKRQDEAASVRCRQTEIFRD